VWLRSAFRALRVGLLLRNCSILKAALRACRVPDDNHGGRVIVAHRSQRFRRPLTSNDLLKWSDGYGWYTNIVCETLRAVFVVYIT
jgi:hypothetical protein